MAASKLVYLLETVPGLREDAERGEALFGTVDCFLIWRLTGRVVHATDVTNASRTLLMDLRSLQWDDELLRIFNIPRRMLPQIRPSSGLFGEILTIPQLRGTRISGVLVCDVLFCRDIMIIRPHVCLSVCLVRSGRSTR